MTFEGCLSDHALGETVEIRRRDEHVSVDLPSPSAAAAKVGLIALVCGGLGALVAVRDVLLSAVVMGTLALVRRGRRTER